MAKKLIICAHGIGDHQKDFHEAWADVLTSNHDSSQFKVVGLHWDDIQDELYDKFFDLPEEVRPIAEQTFLKTIYKHSDDPANQEFWEFLKEYAFDAASYLLLKEFRNAILWPKCIVRLLDLINSHKTYQPVLIGHSLGTIMLTHTTWFVRRETGSLNLHDFFLLGSPLGLRSPVNPIPDFLSLLAEIGNHSNRIEALFAWARNWWHPNRKRLHIIINENDPVAGDVKIRFQYKGVEMELDPIPIRQGFDNKELQKLENANPQTVHRFMAGDNTLKKIIENHSIEIYLNSDPFKSAFDRLL